MSRLLLAKAARLLGRELTAWPALLSDYELAVLEAEDTQVNPCDIVNLLIADPPNISGYMVPRFWSLFFDGRWIDFRKEEPPRPLFTRDDYRQWPARDWEPSPLIAAWFDAHAPALAETSPPKPEARQTEINRWLRVTWEAEDRPGGAAFFRKLRGYKRKPGSPIIEWYQAGKDAGIEYETSAGARGELSIHTIQNKVSEWKGELKQTAAPSNP